MAPRTATERRPTVSLKPCLDCGEPSPDSYCREHRPTKVSSRAKRAMTKRERGYNWRWDQLSRRARRLQPFCSDCGATADLQADHTPEAWRRHEAGLAVRLDDIDVVCGPCNRARGPARGPLTRGYAPTPGSPPPVDKAQTPLHFGLECNAGGREDGS